VKTAGLERLLFDSANASAHFALSCLEPAGEGRPGVRARSSFVDPCGRVKHWHDFGDLEGPGWAANAVGGSCLLYRWGAYTGDLSMREQALLLLDHVLDGGFVQPDGFIWPYWDLAQKTFCLNYTHNDEWLCPGSLAKVGVQMLDLASLLDGGEGILGPVIPGSVSKDQLCAIAARLRHAAQRLGEWLAAHVPLLQTGWTPRRITRSGEPYPLTPEGNPDPIYDHSADGLFLLDLWACLGMRDLGRTLGDAFVSAGGLWGSINHDTYDDHENVAYAVAFAVLRRLAHALDRPAWYDFAYDVALPAMARFGMARDEHGVVTRGLFWMEESWDTAYLWENAEVAQAHLEAWLERGDLACRDVALGTLSAIAHHHYGPLGFLTEGIDWNNHVSRRHHVRQDYYGAIRYTEPLLNNLHLVGPTLTYLQAIGYEAPVGTAPADSIQAVRALSRAARRSRPPGERRGEKARYLLRLFYPALETDESVEAALAFCRQADVDGVLLFESNYDTDPALLPLETLARRFARLREIVPRFRAAGLEVHINVEITMGHGDDGGAHPEWFDLQFQMDERGNISRSTACPLDPAFLDYAGQIYRWAAECGADAVWVDDDVRFLSHDVPGMTCFCPLHLAAMTERTGCEDPWTREGLAQALRDDGRDPSIRQAWFNLQREAMVALAERIEREVHAIDPAQRIGLMSIGSTFHAAEGRRTDRLLRALSGPNVPPMLRPGSGFWHDWQPGAVLTKTEEVRRQVGFLGRDVRVVAEIENHPYSPYQKSLRILGLELALEVLAGAPDLSLNILDSTMPFCRDRGDVDYATFLRDHRPFLDQLAAARAGKARLGIGVEANEDMSRRMPLRGRSLEAWIEPRPWEVIVQRLGLPVGRPYGAPHLLAGDVVYAMDRYALHSALQEGAVLTPAAVVGLIELGYGELIGVRDVHPVEGVNEYVSGDELNGEAAGTRLPVRHYVQVLRPHAFEVSRPADTRVLSRWVDVEGVDCGPSVVALATSDGSRLGLLPFEAQSVHHALLRAERREQWAALFAWVGRTPLPCRVVSGTNLCPQLLADDGDGSALLALVNLSADDATARLRAPVLGNAGCAERLAATGEWAAGERQTRACLQVAVPAWSLAVLRWPPGTIA
jgi:hypothetical protein